MSLVTTVNFNLTAALTGTPGISTSGTPGSNISLALQNLLLTSGVGLNAADKIYEANLSIGSSSSTTLTLNGGAITDDLGVVFSVAKIKAMAFRNNTTTAGCTVSIGAATNPFASFMSGTTPTIVLDAGGFVFLLAPSLAAYAVTATTGMNLKLANNGGSTVSIDLVLIGTSS
jgi:hypothetical protein